MKIVCLDLEGVLVPEIWIEVSKITKIKELSITTREEPNYDLLMKKRIEILKKNNITYSDIVKVISKMEPLEGAKEFVEAVRNKTQLIILSDTFEEFARPLMQKLNWPTLFCNNLIIDKKTDFIVDYKLRQKDGKKKAVDALHSIKMQIFAAGDSYNDLTMIKKADKGLFFRPPKSICEENPEIAKVTTHKKLLTEIEKFLEEK